MQVYENKLPEVKVVLNNLTSQFYNRTSEDQVCITCGSTSIKPHDFTDDLSRKEFTISVMCQKCQDSVFGE